MMISPVVAAAFALLFLLALGCSTAAPDVAGGPYVESFVLVDAGTNKDVMEIEQGSTLYLSLLPTELNIRANVVEGNGAVGSVVFHVDGQKVRTENVAPYALAGDVKGDYSSENGDFLGPGRKTLTAIPFPGRNGGGKAYASATIEFSVQEVAPNVRPIAVPDVAGGPYVESFVLIDAGTNKDVMEIEQGSTLYLSLLPTELNIRANVVEGNGDVGSVVFHVNGQEVRKENVAPYALAGDLKGDYLSENGEFLGPGRKTLTAIPFPGQNGGGKAYATATIEFSVQRDAPNLRPTAAPVAPPKTPVSDPTAAPVNPTAAPVSRLRPTAAPVAPPKTPVSDPTAAPVKPTAAPVSNQNTCDGATFEERNGLAIFEAERARADGWERRDSKSGFTGSWYIQWVGSNNYGRSGEGILSYSVKISTPGTYLFQYKSMNALNGHRTEHNDMWVKFPDADDFFGEKYRPDGERSVVYPKGTGKTPNPRGSSSDGWFKAFMNKGNQWSWDSKTSDHDPHKIYAKFKRAGVYTVLLSGRSNGYAVDRFKLSRTNLDEDDGRTERQTLC